MDTNQMSLVLIFTPANDTQTGPANIASYSSGSASRNFTFGQKQLKYSQRLRTSTGGTNGTPDIDSNDVLNTTGQHHVIVTYDGTNVLTYRNSTLEITEPRTGTFANWNDTYRFMVANESTGTAPWLGRLYHIAIYDRAFNLIQATNVFNGLPPGDGHSNTFSVRWIESP